jgi:hypothetical protein
MHVLFPCPICDRPARLSLHAPVDWECSGCEHRVHVAVGDPALPHCVICGCTELYKKKDFPHWLGMSILVGACLASIYTYFWYDKWLTWAILIGSAVLDGVLYLSVGDAVVCYRCDAHYKGFTPAQSHRPFELTIGERYRQERIRAEQHKPAQENRTHPPGQV